MKHLLIFSFLLFSMAIKAERCTITYINQGTISVNGKQLSMGDVFESTNKIIWQDEGQVIKVKLKKSHKISMISAKTMKLRNLTTVDEMIAQNQSLYSREGILLTHQAIRDYFSRPLAMLKAVSLETGFKTDSTHFFFFQYIHNGEDVNKKLIGENHHLLFDDNIFTIDGEAFTPYTLNGNLFFYEKDTGLTTLVVENVTLNTDLRDDCSVFRSQLPNDLSIEDLQELMTDYCKLKYPELKFNDSDILSFLNQE